ncbi:MAG: hypothetical protein PF484_03105 [Bacteroidales bacterium]|jgi:hypothetical protein|nr:hypothetical protein [Bacteroidales bacterium]
MKIALKLFLLLVIIGLGYMVVESIMEPVRFNKEKDKREQAVIHKLEDIRAGELAYRKFNDVYSASWDTLIDFLKTSEFYIVKEIADPNDTTFTKTIRDTLGTIPIMDSLYNHRANFKIDKLKYVDHLRYVPIPAKFFANEIFELRIGKIERGGVPVQLFECQSHYRVMLKGLDNQLILNLINSVEEMNKYAGLKVGSITEASTEGNWK